MSDPGRGFRGVLNYTLADKKHPDLLAGNMGGTNARTVFAGFGLGVVYKVLALSLIHI